MACLDLWCVSVVCGKIKRERYIITQTQFERLYDVSSAESLENEAKDLHREGFRKFKARDKFILAHTVTQDDKRWLTSNEDRVAQFVAPWGKRARVNVGDILVMETSGEDAGDIYRIKDSVFVDTYKEVHEDRVRVLGGRDWFSNLPAP